MVLLACPVSLGGVRLQLHFHVIEGDCPRLLSIKSLKTIKATLDLNRKRMWFGEASRWISLDVGAQGPLRVQLLNLHPDYVPLAELPMASAAPGPRGETRKPKQAFLGIDLTMFPIGAYMCHRGRLGWSGTSGIRQNRGTITH